ncbi:hypothetical protein C8Q76DRAFT_790772 [Earliella scabrosa]|nr:hypothetical protein C8Q76DRAFT_790772 [Earliella scabrosa]
MIFPIPLASCTNSSPHHHKHLTPNDELLPPSRWARPISVEPGVPDLVWDYYSYPLSTVAICSCATTVECNMLMCHHGGGIGRCGQGVRAPPGGLSPVSDEPMMVDDPKAMDEWHLEGDDDDERGDDDPDAVAQDAAAADENHEEHDPDDLDCERSEDDADSDDQAGDEEGDE